jgi:hypothetical protein
VDEGGRCRSTSRRCRIDLAAARITIYAALRCRHAPVLKGMGARLQRALIAWMLDLHVREHGYVEVYPPAMVKGECLVGTGNLPKFADTLYRDVEEDLWWVPTAEVPVTNLYRDEVLDGDTLPVKHVAYTPCWPRVAFTDATTGIKRGCQFDKVDGKFVRPRRPTASPRCSTMPRTPAAGRPPASGDRDVHGRPVVHRRAKFDAEWGARLRRA